MMTFEVKFSESNQWFSSNFSSSKQEFDVPMDEVLLIKGDDGYSPIVSVEDIEEGHRITITDKNGLHTFDVKDGEKGRTPEKGVDYFTPQDKDEIVRDVLENLPENEGVSSWNDLTDKPFGEEQAFEPIMWDGNTEGLESVDFGALLGGESGVFYKISSACIPMETFNGSTIHATAIGETHSESIHIDYNMSMGFAYIANYFIMRPINVGSYEDFCGGNFIIICAENGYGVPIGVYCVQDSTGYTPHSFTIHKETIKTLDEKYLPENKGVTSWNDLKDKPFETIPADYVVTWDGKTDGLFSLELTSLGLSGYYLTKVSDTVYTEDQIQGMYTHISTGEIYRIENDIVSHTIPGCFDVWNFNIVVVYSQNELNAAIGTPYGYVTNGLYFLSTPSEGVYISGLSRTLETFKTIDEKYLPDTVLTSEKFKGVTLYPSEILLGDGVTFTDIGYFGELSVQERIDYVNTLKRFQRVNFYARMHDGEHLLNFEVNQLENHVFNGGTTIVTYNGARYAVYVLLKVAIDIYGNETSYELKVWSELIYNKSALVSEVIKALPIYNGEVADV